MTRDEMDALTGDTDNKSEKIRRLSGAGVSASAISDYLGIRYQQTYNVLKRAGLLGKSGAAGSSDEALSTSFVVELEPDGLIRLPSDVLKAQGFATGDRLVCRSGDQGLEIMTRDRAIEHLRTVMRNRAGDDLALFDALLTSRRTSGPDPSD